MSEYPSAPKDPVTLINHGIQRIDNFGWLKDREDPRTIPYLEAENQYCEDLMVEHADLRKELYEEMLGRIVEDDQTVPYLLGDWWRYSKNHRKQCQSDGAFKELSQYFCTTRHHVCGADGSTFNARR